MLNSLSSSLNAAGPLAMIPIIAVTGFLDGIHPCAIAILIFFIAFLLTLKKNLKSIIGLGLLYIFIIFLTYLGIGVGLFSGIMLFGQHHFFAKLGSWLLIFLGLMNFRDYFFPRFRLGIKMPRISSQRVKKLLEKSTWPTVVIAAFLVGLCSVPCSGGIYAAITALLASQTTFLTGFLYLLLYNFMFVLPLIILLILTSNPYTLVKMEEWEKKNRRSKKLFFGFSFVIIGILILIFFV